MIANGTVVTPGRESKKGKLIRVVCCATRTEAEALALHWRSAESGAYRVKFQARSLKADTAEVALWVVVVRLKAVTP